MKTNEFRVGFVTVMGETNVGKSTLVNRLVGEKVAIVSPKPQTTRDNAIGVYNDENSQIIFTDTPGMHKVANKIDTYMDKSINMAVKGSDVILYVLTAKKPLVEQYNKINKRNKEKDVPVIILINKIDMTTYTHMYPQLDELIRIAGKDADILPISAMNGKNCDVLLDKLKEKLPKYLNEMRYYPIEQYTDKSIRFLAAEIVREQVLLLYNDEIPHGVAVQLVDYEEHEDIVNVFVEIICERDTHKQIIIGAKGEAIKQLATKARAGIERLVGSQVYLELFVKVKQNWRKESNLCSDLGYDIKSLEN